MSRGSKLSNPSSCAVCANIREELVSGGLAAGFSPRFLSRKFKNLNRSQIAFHRDRCMHGMPRTAFSLRKGWISEDNVLDALEAAGFNTRERLGLHEGEGGVTQNG
jgi:hypothetical protein